MGSKCILCDYEKRMPDLRGSSKSTIAIAATFTAEPLLAALHFVLHEAGLALDVLFSPYNQVLQELLSSKSLLARNENGVNVVLVRLEDFVREAANVDDARALVSRTAGELSRALSQYAQRAKVPTILLVLPPSPGAASALLLGLYVHSIHGVAHSLFFP